jgi:predicted flap endonuclease-1-like 5' DNA nuclease
MVLWYILLGVLIGWVVEWWIDVVYWRGRVQQLQSKLGDCERALGEERERSKLLQAKLRSYEEEQKGLRQRMEQLEAELDRARNERDAAQQQLRAHAARTEAPAAAAPRDEASLPADDLKKIEGIGPKIENLLNEAGIRTFRTLAATSTERLRQILASAGKRFRLADPTTWPRQAEMAAEGRWDELNDYQDALQGGREG